MKKCVRNTLLKQKKIEVSDFSTLLQECIMGALKNKTIILVTHQVDFLHNVDCIMVRVYLQISYNEVIFCLLVSFNHTYFSDKETT